MLIYIVVGGALGTVSRYGLQGWIQGRLTDATLPVGTLVVNILGSLLVGFGMRYGTATLAMSPEVRAGLTVGFCGAFTTMSTLAWESRALVGDGNAGLGVAYLLGTPLACLGATMAGVALATRLL